MADEKTKRSERRRRLERTGKEKDRGARIGVTGSKNNLARAKRHKNE